MTLINQNKRNPCLPRRSTGPLRRGLTALGLALTAALAGCGDAPADPTAATPRPRPTVVATTTVLHDVTRQVAGQDAKVVGLMRVGEDPHVYEVRPQDAKTLAGADLVLANGLHLEATLGRVIDQVAPHTHVELAETAGIEPLGSDTYAGAPDPHIWMDPLLFTRVVTQIGESLASADPVHAQAYRDRATEYNARLTTLHDEITAAFAAIPAGQRVIITSHDAFNYYAKAYGLTVHGVVGISTDAQPTGQQVEALRSLVRDQGVRALFVETSTSPTLNNIVEKVAAEAGIAIGGTLYSDSLGDRGTPGGTYLKMLRHNTAVIVAALTAGESGVVERAE